jgi:hypothetical protein
MPVFVHTVNTLVFPYADTIWQKAIRPCRMRRATGYCSAPNGNTSTTHLSCVLAHVKDNSKVTVAV